MKNLDGVWRKCFLATANSQNLSAFNFSLNGHAVGISAPSSILHAIEMHLHYDRAIDQDIEYNITIIINKNICDDFASNIDIRDLEYCLDYGELGKIHDLEFGRLVYDYFLRSIIAIDFKDYAVSIIVPDYRAAFVTAYKTIRALLTTLDANCGGICLHASSVEIDGNVTAFVGEKGAGKSTCLLANLKQPKARMKYLSNDKLLLNTNSHGISAFSWPTVASFGKDAILASCTESILEPSIHVKSGGLAFMMLNLPLIDTAISNLQSTTKVRLLPSEIEHIFKIPSSTGGRLSSIIVSQLNLENELTQINNISDPEEKFCILNDNLENIYKNHPDWLGLRKEPDSNDLSNFKKHLHGVEVFTAKWGSDFETAMSGHMAAIAMGEHTKVMYHRGVYARIIQDKKILMVKKSRGPYKGKWDLPGGRIECGEDLKQALYREINEELGVKALVSDENRELSAKVKLDEKFDEDILIHEGAICDARLLSEPNLNLHDEDVAGARWINLDSNCTESQFTPFAQILLDEK